MIVPGTGARPPPLRSAIRCPRCSEVFAGRDPASGFHAEHTKIHRIAFRRNNAIFPNHAVLLAAGNNLAGQQQQRTLRVVDQHQPVHLGVFAPDRRCKPPPHQPANISILGHHHFSGSQSLHPASETRRWRRTWERPRETPSDFRAGSAPAPCSRRQKAAPRPEPAAGPCRPLRPRSPTPSSLLPQIISDA